MANGAFLFLVCPSTGRMLLNKRSRFSQYGPGEWFCFGGTIDGVESPYAAMVREIREEAQLNHSDIDIFSEPLLIQRLMGYKGLANLHIYLGVCDSELPITIQKEECEDHGWFTPDDLVGLRLHPTIRVILADSSIKNRIGKYLKV